MILSWSPVEGALVVAGSRRSAIETFWRQVPAEDRTSARRRLVIALVDHIREHHERTGHLAPAPAERPEQLLQRPSLRGLHGRRPWLLPPLPDQPHRRGDDPMTTVTKPGYIYVASSWRNPMQPAVIEVLRAAGLDAYDFRNPEGGTGFSWKQVKPNSTPGVAGKGSDWEPVQDYLAMVHHPIADLGFAADFDAMKRADTFILVLPCGKSAHLELGWAVGAGKRTAILLEDPCEPELMYRMADYLAPSVFDLLGWLGVED